MRNLAALMHLREHTIYTIHIGVSLANGKKYLVNIWILFCAAWVRAYLRICSVISLLLRLPSFFLFFDYDFYLFAVTANGNIRRLASDEYSMAQNSWEKVAAADHQPFNSLQDGYLGSYYNFLPDTKAYINSSLFFVGVSNLCSLSQYSVGPVTMLTLLLLLPYYNLIDIPIFSPIIIFQMR